MLVTPKMKLLDPVMEQITAIIGNGTKTEEIQEGVFLTGDWNFDSRIAEEVETYPEVGEIGPYGVCDYPEQVLGEYIDVLTDPDRRFCISLVRVKKSEQSPDGGWRWHKWGEYIGKKEPKYEYLYDEPDIDEVYTYHIYELI